MTQTSDIQKLLEAADFEPHECIQKWNNPPLYEATAEQKAKGGPVAIVSLMSFLNGAFITHSHEEEKGTLRVGIDQDDVHHTKGKAAVFTLDEIYLRVASAIYTWIMGTDNAHAYVLCADKGKWVVPEKKEEQLDRDHRATPYPEGTTVDADGVHVDGDTGHIQVQRLMQTRSLRLPLFRLLMEKVCHVICTSDRGLKRGVPFKLAADTAIHGIRVIADLTTDVPTQYYQGKQTPRPDLHFPDVGEDDLTMPLIGLKMAENHPLLFFSVDRDMLCILLIHHKRFKHNPVWLQYGDGRTITLSNFVDRMTKSGWTIPWFVLGCCLAGNTDFTKKKWLTDQINARVILACCLSMSKANRPLPLTSHGLRNWLRLLYSQKMDLEAVESEQDLVERGKVGRVMYPGEEDRKKAAQKLTFLAAYWTSLHFTRYTRKQGLDAAFVARDMYEGG